MRVTQAFRFELSPNAAQRKALAQHVGAARFAYNWGLSLCLKALEEGKRIPTAMDLHKEWNRWKREHAPWWKEVSKSAPQEAFRDLERAFKNWFGKRAKKPRFKRKKLLPDNNARLTGSIRVFPRHIQLPRIGRVRSKEKTTKLLSLLEAGKARILSATLSREADRWYVSLSCEVERPDPRPQQGDPIGIDLGLSAFAILSDGTRIEAPKPLKRLERRLKRLNKRFSRKQEGSNNQRKASLSLARLHRRISNIRLDFLHKVTTWLAKTKPVIVLEDLGVKGLARTHLAKSFHDAGWGTFRRMLEYKAGWYGCQLIVAPRSFPSTRLCSACGYLSPRLPLSTRVYRCPSCGLELDRDLNAALNLRHLGLAHLRGPHPGASQGGVVLGPTGSSPGSDACGDPSGGGTALGCFPVVVSLRESTQAGLRATGRGSRKWPVVGGHLEG